MNDTMLSLLYTWEPYDPTPKPVGLRASRTITVRLDAIVATQVFCDERGVNKYRKRIQDKLPDWAQSDYPGAEGRLPLVYEVAGRYHVQDGHHRIKAAMLEGLETIEVELLT